MPIGSKKLLPKLEYATAASQHATITTSGVEISSNYSKFGSTSLRTLVSSGDHLGDCQITVYPKDTSWYMNKNYPWTVEFWVASGDAIWTQAATPNVPMAWIDPDKLSDISFPVPYVDVAPQPKITMTHNGSQGVYVFQYDNDGGTPGDTFQRTFTAVPDWIHVAAVSNGSDNFKWFVNGQVGSGDQTYRDTQNTRTFSFGLYANTTISDWTDGIYYENIRISNIARYTGSFTPPTTPFTPDANTLAIFPFQGDTLDKAF